LGKKGRKPERFPAFLHFRQLSALKEQAASRISRYTASQAETVPALHPLMKTRSCFFLPMPA
jgi:hypothetical protein